jgi:L-alanine-DL-glutamate epimerase-like enolase superfamily enzyme
VHTDAGIYGIGEAASFGGPVISTQTVIEKEIAPIIIGEDPLNVERIWHKVYHQSWQHGRGGILICALSGIDIALWDIIGKSLQTPLYKLLGGYKSRTQAYASGGFYSKERGTRELVTELSSYIKKGYTAIKMKVGRNISAMNPLEMMPDPDYNLSLETDLERVEAVRKAIGSGVKLLVDANAAWDLKTALSMGRHFDRLGVYAFEEPVCTDNREASVQLAEALDLNIAGYESEQLAYNFKEIIRKHCVDIVQPDLSWAGGISECMKIAHLAYAYHKPVSPHCFSSAILLMASLHFICAIPNGGILEIDQNPNALREELIVDLPTVDQWGLITVPEKPGLGVEINEDILEKYTAPAPA